MPRNATSETASAAWTPLITGVDLPTIGKQAFDEKMAEFDKKRAELAKAGQLPPVPFDKDGWYDVTPQMSEASLLNSGGNREWSLGTLKAFGADMVDGDWQATGEPAIFSGGKLIESHHRFGAGLLTDTTFKTYVIVSTPEIENLFAYINCGKKRTNADALHIAGWNGAGKIMAVAVSDLAVRYDAGRLGVQKQPQMKPINARDALKYMEAHPDFKDAANLMLGTYPDAVDVIRSKPAAVFFAWRVSIVHGEDKLDEFCTLLGSGANLPEDSPILAARAKLLAPEDKGNRMKSRTRLAYVCKAFNIWETGQKMPRIRGGKVAPLTIDLSDPFPRIDAPFADAA